MSQPDAVRTGPCPRCRSTRTLAFLSDDGSALIRGCQACGHEWDKSAGAQRVGRMTMTDFYDWIDRERQEDKRLGRAPQAQEDQ